ncbi:polyprenyl synthetase family protein [Rhizobacter sp. AJA081-3]|nr:polyprenyl synthetase family protein [Rhizobacter sp. AJA081-3]
MDAMHRIECALEAAVALGEGRGGPPRLAAAVRHAVFPPGARIRPQLCVAVAHACGGDDPALTDAAAAAVELLHCASLVHDDLPCFDNALSRRGRASVHVAYGERLAVLAGDALIVLAFQQLALCASVQPSRLGRVIARVAAGVAMPHGIAAGQAWECEPRPVLRDYQRAKTGSLFAAAAAAGAESSGADPTPWLVFGDCLGEAYQVADDIRDVVAEPQAIGKPTGQDVTHGRPSSAIEFGLDGALSQFDGLVQGCIAAIPDCRGASALRALVRAEARRLVPLEMTVAHAGRQRIAAAAEVAR